MSFEEKEELQKIVLALMCMAFEEEVKQITTLYKYIKKEITAFSKENGLRIDENEMEEIFLECLSIVIKMYMEKVNLT